MDEPAKSVSSTKYIMKAASFPPRDGSSVAMAARCTRQRAGAGMCSGRACAVHWKCVLECAPWACACSCSRARVRVCCAGAAGRAYSRRKRRARSRAAELPDLASRARAPAMGAVFTELFFGTAVLEWFVNITLGSADEVAGDATQVQSTDERNQIDRIRHHSDVGTYYRTYSTALQDSKRATLPLI